MHTLNMIYVLLVTKSSKVPIIPLYLVMSKSNPLSSLSINTLDAMCIEILLEYFISNFLRRSKKYFILLMKISYSSYLICKLSNKRYLKFSLNQICKLSTEKFISVPKIICFFLCFINKLVSTFPQLNPCLIKNPPIHSYQALRDYLRPYKALFNLKTRLGLL